MNLIHRIYEIFGYDWNLLRDGIDTFGMTDLLKNLNKFEFDKEKYDKQNRVLYLFSTNNPDVYLVVKSTSISIYTSNSDISISRPNYQSNGIYVHWSALNEDEYQCLNLVTESITKNIHDDGNYTFSEELSKEAIERALKKLNINKKVTDLSSEELKKLESVLQTVVLDILFDKFLLSISKDKYEEYSRCAECIKRDKPTNNIDFTNEFHAFLDTTYKRKISLVKTKEEVENKIYYRMYTYDIKKLQEKIDNYEALDIEGKISYWIYREKEQFDKTIEIYEKSEISEEDKVSGIRTARKQYLKKVSDINMGNIPEYNYYEATYHIEPVSYFDIDYNDIIDFASKSLFEDGTIWMNDPKIIKDARQKLKLISKK